MNCCGFITELQLREGCPCDRLEFPPALRIIAGLNSIPRKIAGFSDFRHAMLADINSESPLYQWRAREGNDPGIMLLEMWAYICNSIAFYDEVIANEAYLRTATQPAALSRLASLLGYLPRPAVASMVSLAAFAEGRQILKIPAGTAFRSGAFEGNPPQVFETSRDLNIHPFTNRWSIEPPVKNTVGASNPDELLVNPLTVIKPGMVLFLRDSGGEKQNQAVKVKQTTLVTATNKMTYCRLSLFSRLKLTGNTPLSNLTLSFPAQTANILWKGIDITTGDRDTFLILDKLYPENSIGDYIMISKGNEFHWYKVKSMGLSKIKASEDQTLIINNNTFKIAGNTIPVTKLYLESASIFKKRKVKGRVKPDGDDPGRQLLHFNMQLAGQIVSEPAAKLYPAMRLSLKDPVEEPAEKHHPADFILNDKYNLGMMEKGQVSYKDKTLELKQVENWTSPLAVPVEAFGNVIQAIRGETVRQEILGSGDASLVNQTFKLKKKPLTYLFSPSAENDRAVKSVLEVRVNGILWKEVANFFGVSPFDPYYIVRQDEEGETSITFGDGISGRRLPSGKDNVVAMYRFGSGKASPPAQSITQVATPVKGLKSVLNPLAASGGADPETADEIRSKLPKSAMLLGRVISIRDVEAAIGDVPMVRAYRVEWSWIKTRQNPMIHILYIGDQSSCSMITQRLNEISDPNIGYHVERVKPDPVNVVINISIDQKYDKDELIAAVRECLMNPDHGLLAPEVVGIGQPVYRSRLYEGLMSIEGITGIGEIIWDGQTFHTSANLPETGYYFDVEAGELKINEIIG